MLSQIINELALNPYFSLISYCLKIFFEPLPEGLYSFVPVKIFNQDKESDYAIKQPVIQLDFLEHLQTQVINSIDCSLEKIIDFWKRVVNQIDENGLNKGIRFKTPELKNNFTK
jgi:hypothetical protein